MSRLTSVTLEPLEVSDLFFNRKTENLDSLYLESDDVTESDIKDALQKDAEVFLGEYPSIRIAGITKYDLADDFFERL